MLNKELAAALSVQLGEDLTADGDLEHRLGAAAETARSCCQLLQQTEQAVVRYQQVLNRAQSEERTCPKT